MGGWSWDDAPADEESKRDSENAARQARRVVELVRTALKDPASFALTPTTLCELNNLAVVGLVDNPGAFRKRDVEIVGSRHEPPRWELVPDLVEDMCRVLNEGNDEPLIAAAYVMWRLNWIHPFEGGNGRTSRAASYLVLCVGLDRELTGETTLVERLLGAKVRYYRALEAADRAHEAGGMDVSALAALLEELLTQQLGG